MDAYQETELRGDGAREERRRQINAELDELERRRGELIPELARLVGPSKKRTLNVG
jgi:hypothetical protein